MKKAFLTLIFLSTLIVGVFAQTKNPLKGIWKLSQIFNQKMLMET